MADPSVPSLASPTRRPLQDLNPNFNLTPRQFASGKATLISPVRNAVSPPTPATILSSKKVSTVAAKVVAETMILNPSKKRTIDEVLAGERDQNRASFSSLINFDPASDDAEPTSSATIADDYLYKSIADTLKLRLQMAMFRIRTNQISTPFSELQVPQSHTPTMQRLPNTSQDIVTPSTPRTRIRSCSNSSVEDDMMLARTTASKLQRRDQPPHEGGSSIGQVREDAISGLLELRRGT